MLNWGLYIFIRKVGLDLYLRFLWPFFLNFALGTNIAGTINTIGIADTAGTI